MRYEEAVAKHEPLTPYEKGLVAGIYRFAWQKDGVFYVGTTGSLLGDGIDRAITEYRESWPPRVSGPDADAIDAEALDEAICEQTGKHPADG